MTKEIDNIDVLDLSDLDTSAGSDRGAEFELLHPTNDRPTGLLWTVLGKHGEVFQEHVAEKGDRRIAAAAESRKKGVDEPQLTAEQVKNEAIDLLVLCSTGWRTVTRDKKGEIVKEVPTIRFEGEDLAFNVKNCRRVLEKLIWVREQVDSAIGNLSLFIKA